MLSYGDNCFKLISCDRNTHFKCGRFIFHLLLFSNQYGKPVESSSTMTMNNGLCYVFKKKMEKTQNPRQPNLIENAHGWNVCMCVWSTPNITSHWNNLIINIFEDMCNDRRRNYGWNSIKISYFYTECVAVYIWKPFPSQSTASNPSLVLLNLV